VPTKVKNILKDLVWFQCRYCY